MKRCYWLAGFPKVYCSRALPCTIPNPLQLIWVYSSETHKLGNVAEWRILFILHWKANFLWEFEFLVIVSILSIGQSLLNRSYNTTICTTKYNVFFDCLKYSGAQKGTTVFRIQQKHSTVLEYKWLPIMYIVFSSTGRSSAWTVLDVWPLEWPAKPASLAGS